MVYAVRSPCDQSTWFPTLGKIEFVEIFLRKFGAKRFLTWWIVEVEYKAHRRRVGTLILSRLRGASDFPPN